MVPCAAKSATPRLRPAAITGVAAGACSRWLLPSWRRTLRPASRHGGIVLAVVGVLAMVGVMALGGVRAAHARDMTGKAGIGLLLPTSPMISSTPVLALRYWRRHLAMDLLGGYDFWQSNRRDEDQAGLYAGVGVHWLAVDAARFSAGIGLRTWGQYSSHRAADTGDATTFSTELGLLVEALLTAEWFFSDHIGVSAAIGPTWFLTSSFRTVSRSSPDLTALLGNRAQRGGTVWELGGRYSGGLGLVFYL